MSEVQTTDWSEVAASNNQNPPAGWPEGMLASAVNDSAREMMAALKRDWNRTHPTVTSGGTSSAITLTYTTAPTAYAAGLMFTFKVGTTNAAAATLNVNGLGAVALYYKGAAVPASVLQSAHFATVAYDGTYFQIVSTTTAPTLVGDSGSGGLAGLVPAPAAGDAAAGKVLTAAGTWATAAGGGSAVSYQAYGG